MKIIQNLQIAPEIYELILEGFPAEHAEKHIKNYAGKFVSVYTGDSSMLLPRPISICEMNTDSLRLIYKVVGRGTRRISEYAPGEDLKIMGPLGNGFSPDISAGNIAVIGGGIGTPPMLALARRVYENDSAAKTHVFLGFRDKTQVILEKDFYKYTNNVHIATDLGDYGIKGTVIDLLNLNNNEFGTKFDGIYACGSKLMLKAVADWANERGIPCFISLEERMACTVGACLGCAVKTVSEDMPNGFWYKKVCDCGPVFNAKEIIW
ncbi:MAG: dihydroorotate dehydrogenase electron transfer subunit [Defluviitaleaceae bacterium]|nr:dihydroorotate dehydrogenase electron transfer subunit [Defluviitaleaceae bacterium]